MSAGQGERRFVRPTFLRVTAGYASQRKHAAVLAVEHNLIHCGRRARAHIARSALVLSSGVIDRAV
jgi:hypothetical protein